MSSNTQNIFSVEKEVKKEIMSTDVYVLVQNYKTPKPEIEKDVAKAFDMFRDFEKRFSRFIKGNELENFNSSEGDIEVSEDMFELLKLSCHYNKFTRGLFDPSVHKILLNEGYTQSFFGKKEDASLGVDGASREFREMELTQSLRQVHKPKGLSIEFGGIGKGYIVDKVSQFLSTKYKNFVVDAGGDIYFSGSNIYKGYEFWATDVEDPKDQKETVKTLIISNKGVATSGVNKRKWQKNGNIVHHIIDPRNKKSTDNNVLSSTVVSNSVVESDVLAKTLLIMGIEKGIDFANENNIAILFVDKALNIFQSLEMEKYVWKE